MNSDTVVAGVVSLSGDFFQVSTASTSPYLSDTEQYPNFMRLPAPDDKQAQVILLLHIYLLMYACKCMRACACVYTWVSVCILNLRYMLMSSANNRLSMGTSLYYQFKFQHR